MGVVSLETKSSIGEPMSLLLEMLLQSVLVSTKKCHFCQGWNCCKREWLFSQSGMNHLSPANIMAIARKLPYCWHQKHKVSSFFFLLIFFQCLLLPKFKGSQLSREPEKQNSLETISISLEQNFKGWGWVWETADKQLAQLFGISK